jgi:mycothiol synthase
MLANRNLNPPILGKAGFGILGLSFRNLRTAYDYLGIAGLRTTCQYEDGVERMVTAREIANELERPHGCLPRRNVILAELAGRLLGYTAVRWRTEADGGLVISLSGCVHPGWRRRGIGGTLLKLAEKRAVELAQMHSHGVPALLLTSAYEAEHGKRVLLEQSGYQANSYSLELVRDLDKPIPPGGQADTIEIKPGRPQDGQSICHVVQANSMDDLGVGLWRAEEYQALLDQPLCEPQLWALAWFAGQVAGWAINLIRSDENEMYNRARGYTECLCIRKTWLGRGLASNLLIFSLRALRGQGMTEAAMDAAPADRCGREQIYDGLGYQTRQIVTTYAKSLSLPVAPGGCGYSVEA